MKNSVFETADLGLAAFLVARGYKLAGIRREAARGYFRFAASEELDRDVLAWINFEPVALPVQNFGSSVKFVGKTTWQMA